MRKATKKFQLNKETIANLEDGVLTDIMGGGTGSNLYTGCNTACSCPVTK